MMDQEENLRNIIKKQNLKNITNSRVIAEQVEKAVLASQVLLLILQCGLQGWGRKLLYWMLISGLLILK